jgi:hypothetical protein
MNWQTALVVLLALAIGFGVLARIAGRGAEPAAPATPDPARVTIPER